MKNVTFVAVGNRVTLTYDGGGKIGLRGELNLLPHPFLDAIIITPHVSDVISLNSLGDSIVVNVADVTTPLSTDKFALITALQSIFK